MSRYSWRSSSTRCATACGWAAIRPATARCSPIRSICARSCNTLLLLLVGVNLKMLLALLLSGFFMRKGWWMKLLLLIFILPWAVPAIPSYISHHWMLNGQWGLINNIIWTGCRRDGPPWLTTPTPRAWRSVIYGHIWKWLPFWTVIFLAGRMAIPRELYEAAEVDGASRLQKFRYVTFPMMARLYLVCTMLSTIWALGDFNAVRFISGGGPALSTHVLATLGIRNAFELGDPGAGHGDGAHGAAAADPAGDPADAPAAANEVTSYDAPRRRRPARSSRRRTLAAAVGGADPGLDAAADLQHGPRVAAGEGGGASQHLRLPVAPSSACLQHRVHPEPSGCWRHSGARWATASTSASSSRCSSSGDRVADQFHHQPDAHPQRLDADQCGAADLCDPDRRSWPSRSTASWANTA